MKILKVLSVMLALLCLAAAGVLTACGPNDLPPDNGKEAPDPLNGVFIYEDSLLTFNGDGRSISLRISQEFSAVSGLPEGEWDAQYVFLFGNKEYRYDLAETFRIITDDGNYEFPNIHGTTAEDLISIRMPDGQTVWFTKPAQE